MASRGRVESCRVRMAAGARRAQPLCSGLPSLRARARARSARCSSQILKGPSDACGGAGGCAERLSPRARRIKAQQAAFQAAKKLTGNSHTAGGMGWNVGVFLLIAVGCGVNAAMKLPALWYGSNKYVVPDDD